MKLILLKMFKGKSRVKKRYLVLLIVAVLIAITSISFGDDVTIKYVERKSGDIKIEKVAGEGWLKWLYNTPFGKLPLNAIVKRKFLSEYYGKKMDAPESAKKVETFVKDFDIDLSIAKKKKFTSFNDFFIRELKDGVRPIVQDSNAIASPADGKILAYDNTDKDFIVKGYKFNLKEYLRDDKLAKKYEGGCIVLVRLCPVDYHRYHFPVSGEVVKEKKIKGALYSVSPIALKKKIEIFCENKREYTIVKSDRFGDVLFSEIGATMVGSIIQTYKGKNVTKGQEKGYFKFGGSSVLLLFEKGKIKLDKDLLENTAKDLETQVEMGEQIGVQLDS